MSERNPPAAKALSIGVNIRRYRMAEGLTLKQLAERSGVSIATISKIENGKISGGFETIYKIARGLAVRATEANWVLVDEPRLRDRLIAYDVLVRDCASFGMASTFRIAVPDDAGLDRLDAALAGAVDDAELGR